MERQVVQEIATSTLALQIGHSLMEKLINESLESKEMMYRCNTVAESILAIIQSKKEVESTKGESKEGCLDLSHISYPTTSYDPKMETNFIMRRVDK